MVIDFSFLNSGLAELGPCILEIKEPGRLRGVRRKTRRSSLPSVCPSRTNGCHRATVMDRFGGVFGKVVFGPKACRWELAEACVETGLPPFWPGPWNVRDPRNQRMNLHDKGDRSKGRSGDPKRKT